MSVIKPDSADRFICFMSCLPFQLQILTTWQSVW